MPILSFFLILVLLSPSIYAQAPVPIPEKPLLGIKMQDASAIFRQLLLSQQITSYKSAGAIVINKVIPGTVADKSGFKQKDLIFEVDGQVLDKEAPVKSFQTLIAKYQVGDSIFIKGIRYKKEYLVADLWFDSLKQAIAYLNENSFRELNLRQNVKTELLEKQLSLGSWLDLPPLKNIPDTFPSSWTSNQQTKVFKTEINSTLLDKITDSLFVQKMQSDALKNIPGPNTLAFFLQNNPTASVGVINDIKSQMTNNQDRLFEILLQTQATPDLPMLSSQDDILTQLKTLLSEIRIHNKKLHNFKTKYEQTFEHLKSRYQNTENSKDDSADVHFQENLDSIIQFSKEQQPFSNDLLFRLSNYFSDQRITLIKNAFATVFIQDVVDNKKVIELDGFTIVIGGKQNNTYYNGADLIIDLGGDDQYFTGLKKQNKPIIIDISGHDIYKSLIDFQWGAGYFQISYLLDVEGNDQYYSKNFSLGSAFMSAALLHDKQGNDVYSSAHLSMASGLLGHGILQDESGDDTYISGTLSQAAGLFKGQGYLIEKAGNDRYISTAWVKSGYPDDDSFDGVSMGIGVGLRNFCRGGLGILFDYQGNDNYEVGNFGLGTGYYFGMGGVIDLKGDDTYQTKRYGIGAAAHSAIGFFIDSSGNDHYTSSQHAIAGAAWDLSLAYFLDQEGDDYYRSDFPFSFAAAEHNSLAIHLDKGGNDSYEKQFFSQQTNNYHNGQSFGIFVNSGGKDSYPSPFINDSRTQNNQFYFFDR